jgi:hypothetical protein
MILKFFPIKYTNFKVVLFSYTNQFTTFHQSNNETRSFNHYCSGKAINITYTECVFVALDIQHKMRNAMLSFVASPAVQYFSTLSPKWRGFPKKKWKAIHIKYLFWFSLWLSSETFFIWTKIYVDLCVKHPLFLLDFNWNWIFTTNCCKVLKYETPWKFL